MSNDVVIKVEGLSKKYLLKRKGTRQTGEGLRHVIQDFVTAPTRMLRSLSLNTDIEPQSAKTAEDFYALKDVSFEIKKGDVVGIVGRNGAGKSTLLKILSRITEPTVGRIGIKGRIASLLEVGTGFHPELSGRENIYLNGAILGMTRSEVKRQFDEIVAFAGIEKFMETPVKRYSSGMYVRLAFAVAAHLEPEILIVDEVLAVGDAQFQKKCLGKMKDVAGTGRTVLFVSHQMSMLEQLCTKGFLFDKGKISKIGGVHDVVKDYHESSVELANLPLSERKDRRGEGKVRIERIELLDSSGMSQTVVSCAESITLRMHFRKSDILDTLRGVRFSIACKTQSDTLFVCSTELTSREEWKLDNHGVVDCRIPKLPLSSGRYRLTLYAEAFGVTQDWVEDAVLFEVEGGAYYQSGRQTISGYEGKNVLVEHHWSLSC